MYKVIIATWIFYIYAKVSVWSLFFNISSKSFLVIYLNFFSLMVDIFYQLSLWGVCNVHYIFEMKRLYLENLFYLSHKYWQNDFSSNVTLVVYSHLLLFLRVFSYNVAIGDQISHGIVTHVLYYIMIIDSLTLATYIGYIWTVTINTRSIFDKFFQKKHSLYAIKSSFYRYMELAHMTVEEPCWNYLEYMLLSCLCSTLATQKRI